MDARRKSDGGAPVDVSERTVAAWDLPTRLFHWSLVTLVVMAYVSRRGGDAGLVWHKWNGYAILVLIVWRVFWGFTGSSTARFKSFFYWPWWSMPRALSDGHSPFATALISLPSASASSSTTATGRCPTSSGTSSRSGCGRWPTTAQW